MKALWAGEMFTFHSGAWWRHLWEKTGLVKITACYDIDDPKAVWQSWADWSEVHFEKEFGEIGGDNVSDVQFLNADTENDIALIVMAATKNSANT